MADVVAGPGPVAAGWWLGTGRADITPTGPVALAGFATRVADGPATAIAAPLAVRAVVLRPADPADPDPADPDDADVRATVIVVADVLCWGDDTAAEVRRRCRDRLGLGTEQLLLHATHTHSAPQPSTRFHPGLGVPDPAWIDLLIGRTVTAITDAWAGREPVTVHTATGEVGIGVERRHARTGGQWPAAPLDRRVRVMTARRGDGSVAATLFHHACHPTIHHANRVSAEFPGAAMSALEHDGHATIALHLQGCCGDVNPDRYQGTTFVDGDQTAVEETGRRLADAVVVALGSPGPPIAPDPVHRRRRIVVPTAATPPTEELERAAATDDPVVAGWARLLLERPERRTEPAEVTVHLVRLGDGVGLLGFSAELTSRYGRVVDELAGADVWPLGYTGGMLGYLVTDEQLAQGGYEADEAPYWFAMPGPLVPGAETLVRDAVADLLSDRTGPPAHGAGSSDAVVPAHPTPPRHSLR